MRWYRQLEEDRVYDIITKDGPNKSGRELEGFADCLNTGRFYDTMSDRGLGHTWRIFARLRLFKGHDFSSYLGKALTTVRTLEFRHFMLARSCLSTAFDQDDTYNH
jgi:hypothetical protein